MSRALPEALATTSRNKGGWRVTYAPPVRGACHTNRTTREMAVPDEADYTSRAIRAHEMAHAAFSPMDNAQALAPFFGVAADALAVAEEARVNVLSNSAGADVTALQDGSEKNTARLAGIRNDFRAALLLTLGTWGTGAEGVVKSSLSRNAPKSWRKPLTEFRRQVRAQTRNVYAMRDLSEQTAQRTDDEGNAHTVAFPGGFYVAVRLAKLLASYEHAYGGGKLPTDKEAREAETQASDVRKGDEAARRFERKPEHTSPGSNYQDVRLMVGDLDATQRGKIAKKRIAAPTGKKPRRLSRLMTDQERRVFDRYTRTRGGVVLVDMSGSMHLADGDIDAILEAAGSATVIGYSDIGRNMANVWVIAENGQRATNYPRYGSNNGVDGSALNFAATKRQNKREPFIWVTDGRAYDKSEGFGPRTAQEIHDTCTRHGVHVADDVADAIRELQRCARGNTCQPRLSPWAEARHQANQNGETD